MATSKRARKTNKVLYNEVDDPNLIKAVVKELRNHDAKLILAKLEDLEKAIYHIAGKQQDMIDAHKELEKVVVNTATVLEEMMNGADSAIIEEDTTEDNFLADAWGSKKKVVSPTSN